MAVRKHRVLHQTNRLTQRAPDGWDSARFLSWFCAMVGFRFPALFSPAAGNASRWLALCKQNIGETWQTKNIFLQNQTRVTQHMRQDVLCWQQFLLLVGLLLNFFNLSSHLLLKNAEMSG